MDSPEFWRWVWLTAAVALGIGEMATAGSFFLLPFAAGAAVAAVLAFLDVGLAFEWAVFVGISVAAFLALRPIARRLDRGEPTHGIGALRLIGQQASVLADIPGDQELGLVRVHREEWRAESADGNPIPTGARVRIVEVRGTRVVVHAVDNTVGPPSQQLEPGQFKEQ